MPRVGHLLARRRTPAGQDGPGAVGDQREGAAARDGAALVGEGAAQPDGGLQLGAGPVQLAVAEREDAQLVVEVGLFAHVIGEPGGLGTGPQRPLPGTPVQPSGERGRRRAGQLHGDALVLLVEGRRGERNQDGERGEHGVGLGADPLRGDRGCPAHQV